MDNGKMSGMDKENGFKTRIILMLGDAKTKQAKIPKLPGLRLLLRGEELRGRIKAFEEALQIHAVSSNEMPTGNPLKKFLERLQAEIDSLEKIKAGAEKKSADSESSGSPVVVNICDLQIKTLNRAIKLAHESSAE